MRRISGLVALSGVLVLGLTAPAFAGSATDAALGLGAFAVFNQLFGGLAAPRTVVVEHAPAVVYAPPPPVVYAPPPVAYPPPPVVYAPPPAVYYAPPPAVVYGYPYPRAYRYSYYPAYRW